MTTIDKLDISVYNMYALRTRMIEQINQQMHLDESASIPAQIQVTSTSIQLTELDLLLGVVPLLTPWAYFFPPTRFKTVRRSPFSFSRVAPSLGSAEKQAEDIELIENTPCSTPDEESEKSAIIACFQQLEKINTWLSFIVGRIGQFLQG